MRADCINNYFFLSFTLHLPPHARVRVSTPVKKVKEGKKSGRRGSSRAFAARYARGNSRKRQSSLFQVSEL